MLHFIPYRNRVYTSLAGFVILIFALSSCGNSRPPVDAARQALKDDSLIQNYIKVNHIQAVKDTSGLYYQVIEPGAGATPAATSTVTVNYSGKLLNGQAFDASKPGKPLSFSLDQVIKGWTLGIPHIKSGGKILLLVPSRLGYGNDGGGPIPPDAVLIFTVELLKVS